MVLELSKAAIFCFKSEAIGKLEVRHPRQRRWLDELGRLKGGRPLYTSFVIRMELSDI
jgi:hypothetical protein